MRHTSFDRTFFKVTVFCLGFTSDETVLRVLPCASVGHLPMPIERDIPETKYPRIAVPSLFGDYRPCQGPKS